MSVRELLQKDKIVGVVVALALFAVAGSITAFTLLSGTRHPSPTGAFMSDDDGQSFYSDTIYHFPPFEHDGKTALRAAVYSSNSGKFVGVLMRYTPETKKLLEDEYAKASRGEEPMYMVLRMIGSGQARAGTEYKLPGSGHQWSRGVPRVKAPDGSVPIMVQP
ncbi:MAG: hypothetical protein ABSH08_12410 [Tepidisphaeraceae bacterium]|jgi:hypothetical protein